MLASAPVIGVPVAPGCVTVVVGVVGVGVDDVGIEVTLVEVVGVPWLIPLSIQRHPLAHVIGLTGIARRNR